jgi:transposase
LSAYHDELEQKLVLLHKTEKTSIRALCRRFQLGRNTIRKILRKHEKQRAEGHEILARPLLRSSKLDAHATLIEETLKKYPDITGVRLYEKLQDAGYQGGITIVRDRLKKLGIVKQEPVIRFETEPGQQGQMDWSPYTIRFTRTGKATVQCFSYILGFSRRQYIDFTPRRDFHTLIRRHQDAFAYYDGVPRECLYDNEKTVVLRWEGGRPVYNPSFSAFITHYQCGPVACRPRTPRIKGKIERPFQYVETNLLGGREFQDLEDLRATARWWLREKSDLHIHDTTGKMPIELFVEEKEKLMPLPPHPYDTAEVVLVVCQGDGYVTFETNAYSVPSGHVADIMTIKATEKEVLIYSPELVKVASYERQPTGAKKRLDNPEHRKTKRDRYGLEPVRGAFLALGAAAEEFLQGLLRKQPRNCGFHARFILRLKERYETGDINKAILHATRYQAFEGGAIERILLAKAVPRTLESIRNEHAGHTLEKALPQVTQRPLEEYSALLNQETEHETRDDRGTNNHPDQTASEAPETHRDGEGA